MEQKIQQIVKKIIVQTVLQILKFIVKYRARYNAKYRADITIKQTIELIIRQAVSGTIVTIASIIIIVSIFNKVVVNEEVELDDHLVLSFDEIEEELEHDVYPISSKVEDIKQAQELNEDVQAWLEIPNTNIDHPIMQTDNNSFYLDHNEEGEYDIWGTYFADYFATIDSVDTLTQNTVIYGHTNSENPDGEKFSQLYQYLDLEYLKANPYIYLTIEGKELPFEIFAVFYSHIDLYYINPTPSDMPFDYFLEEVNKRNEYVFANTQVLETDQLLTLSGCSYKYDVNDTGNHRFVVMAKLVKEEQENIDITINENPLRPQP